MSRTEGRSSAPRAVIHKKILDAAESDPSASMEEIADGIGGASTELVERVLEEYGDPADDQVETQPNTETETSENMDVQDSKDEMMEFVSTLDVSEPYVQMNENGQSDVDPIELTEKQMKTLQLIEESPDASQSDLSEEFDVTRATISRWLNDIPGFEWTRRQKIASEILNSSYLQETNERLKSVRSGEIDQRLDTFERRLDRLETESGMGFGPELAHRVVHACINSERITEEEELEVLKELMG